MVDLVLRESTLTQTVSSAPVTATNLVVRTSNTEKAVIPSISLPGTRFLRTQDLRNSFQISNTGYFQTISASSTSTTTCSLGIAISRAIVVTTLASRVLSITVQKAITSATSTSLARGVSRTISTSVSNLIAKTVSISVVKSITESSSVAISKGVSVLKSISQGSSVSTNRSLDKILAFVSSTSMNIGKGLAVTKSIAAPTSPTLSRVLAYLKGISVTNSPTISIIGGRSYLKDVSASVSSSLLLAKGAGKIFSVQNTCVPTKQLQIGVNKSIPSSSQTTHLKGVGLRLNTLASSVVTQSKQLAKTLNTISSSIGSLGTARALILNFIASSSLSLSSTIARIVYKVYSTIYALALQRTILASVLDRVVESIQVPISYIYSLVLGRIVHSSQLIRTISDSMSNFSPKTAREVQIFGFDFSSVLATGETISSTTVVQSTPKGKANSGTLFLSGTANIDGTSVTQKVGGGISGDVYILECTINTSLGQVFVLSGSLSIN